MKRSFQVNFDNKIYNIDEDAYALLRNYMTQLEQSFPGEDGREIVNDINARISELFAERAIGPDAVIDINCVNEVIAIVGRPEDFCETKAETDTEADTESNEYHRTTPPPYNSCDNTDNHANKMLYRDIDNKVIGGVLSGLANFYGLNPNMLRICVVVFAICTYVWPMILAYILALIFIKPADTPRRRLEMAGLAVSPANIGDMARATTPGISPQTASSFARILSGFFQTALGIMSITLFIAAIGIFTGGIAALVNGLMVHYQGFVAKYTIVNFNLQNLTSPTMALLDISAICFAVALPAFLLAWLLAIPSFKLRSIPTATIVCIIVIEIILVVFAVVANPFLYV